MKLFVDFKIVNERASKKVEVDYQGTKPPYYHFKESKEASTPDDKEARIWFAIDVSLEYQWQLKELAKPRA